MPRSLLAVAAAVLAAAVVAGCTSTEVPERVAGLRAEAEGVAAPDADALLVEGGWPLVAAYVRDAADAGEATVVNLFGSWCAPCERELPLLLDVSAGTDGVRWIGVAVQDREEDARDMVERLDVWWPTVRDWEGDVYDALAALAMPTTAFFDAEGTLVSVVTGELDEERLAEELAGVTG